MKRILFFTLATLFVFTGLLGCAPKQVPHPDNPVTLNIWHVYGAQTESPFNDSIDEFNKTVGRENGVIVNVVSVSSSSAIDEALAASAKNTPGVPTLPDLFTAYPRVAQSIGYDRLLDWSDYFTDEELNLFIDEFVAEGYFGEDLLMLPIAKSTELMFVNQTLFDKFAAESDITSENLLTYESLFSACEKYYDWSGGRDMFQINDFYHYALSGMATHGESLVLDGKLNVASDAFRKIWEPLAHAGIHGGVCLGDGYASDRWKTGEIISNVGSTAGVLYLRDYVTYADNTKEDIETSIMAYPRFENAEATVVHRGGGLFALKHEDERKNKAAACFAKWITEKENNLDFVTKAGYLPVTSDAFAQLFDNTDKVENDKYRLLYEAVSNMSEDYTYCEVPVYDGASDTQSNFEKNVKFVLNAAHDEYLRRISEGENADAVLDNLILSSLADIRSMYS